MKYCPKCQCETERYAGGKCKPCLKAYDAARYADNPDEAKSRAAAWRAANPEKQAAANAFYRSVNAEKYSAYNSAWRAANPEKVKTLQLKYRAANVEKIKANKVAWQKANPDKVKACNAAWRAANPEKQAASSAAWRSINLEALRIYSHNRRAKKRANGGMLSHGLSAKLFKFQNGKCPCCGQPLGKNYHMDHILPLALGGSNTDDNIQLLRQHCNNQKSAKHPIDFMQSKGFLL